MSSSSSQSLDSRLEEVANRVDWLDSERRAASRRARGLEKQVASLEIELKERNYQIEALEEKLRNTSTQISRLSQSDSQIPMLREEVIKLVEEADQKNSQRQAEIEKMRAVESDVQQREIATLKREIDSLNPLQREMELREAEETRLAGLISALQTAQSDIERELENNKLEMSFLQEATTTNARTGTDLQTRLQENLKRIDSLENQHSASANQLEKNHSSVQALAKKLESQRQEIKDWSDQIQMGEYQRKQRVDALEAVIEDHSSTMERYAREWITFVDQYKESKMALGKLEDWMQKADQKQIEIGELTRVEIERTRARWESFIEENESRIRNFELDLEQHISALQRRHKSLSEKLEELQESTTDTREAVEAIMRIQTAQSDAIKKWPRIFIEEVEKAIAHNPNSRRQPALMPVREE